MYHPAAAQQQHRCGEPAPAAATPQYANRSKTEIIIRRRPPLNRNNKRNNARANKTRKRERAFAKSEGVQASECVVGHVSTKFASASPAAARPMRMPSAEYSSTASTCSDRRRSERRTNDKNQAWKVRWMCGAYRSGSEVTTCLDIFLHHAEHSRWRGSPSATCSVIKRP